MCEMIAALPARNLIRRYLPLACLLAVAVAIIVLRWPSEVAKGPACMASDTGRYVAIAEAIRHGAIERNLQCWPPGFPIVLTLMPASLTATTAIVVSALAFLAALALLYVAGLRYAGTLGATVSGACWLLLFHYSPTLPMLPFADNLFIAVALLAVLARRPLAIGLASGFAALTRPEGMALTFLLGLRQRHWRAILTTLAVAATIYSPYVLVLHSLRGEWMLTGKQRYNWSIAPYRVAGVARADLTAMQNRFGSIPPPTDARVVEVIGHAQRARARLLMRDVPFRVSVNLHTWWIALRQIASLPLLGLAVLGAGALAWYRRTGPLCDAACLTALSLTWIPYFYIGHRGMLPAFAALALLAGASILPITRWVAHNRSAGILARSTAL